MARPFGIEIAGAVELVLACGNGGDGFVGEEDDWVDILSIPAEISGKAGWPEMRNRLGKSGAQNKT